MFYWALNYVVYTMTKKIAAHMYTIITTPPYESRH
jgi:hypothetical protein